MNKYFVNSIGIWADDDRFIQDVLIREEYKFVFDYDTVVDLGANIGTFSIWIYSYAQKIFAVEPNPKPMRLLEKTITENNLTKIIPVECAITGQDGDRFMKNTDDSQYGSGEINDKEGITVKGVALDTFMVDNKIEHIDLLKVDIERSEKELFESEGFRNAAKRIGVIIGEYHDNSIRDSIKTNIEASGFIFKDLNPSFIARR